MSTQNASGKWNDLWTRIGSAAFMVVIGLYCIWHAGHLFHGLVGIVAGLMIWELVRMRMITEPKVATLLGVLGGCVVFLTGSLPLWATVALLLAVIVIVGWSAGREWKVLISYGAAVLVGSAMLIAVRDTLGFGWLMLVVMVVIASDVAGYFAGKTFGGPKFWPAISPKKTWSGTIAGWGGAALVGWGFGLGSGVTGSVILLSIVLSFAGQMGDIAESAIKRSSGVKDSSGLIPGHGGVLDRFDALLGASLALLVVIVLTGFPQGFL